MSAPRQDDQHLLRTLVEHGQDLVLVIGTDAGIEYASPSAERVLGFAPDEMIGNAALDYVHTEDRARTMAAILDVLRHLGGTRTLEVRTRHKDGGWRTLEFIGTSVRWDDGAPRVVVNGRDVTERKHVERALRASRERLRALTETAVDAIVTADAEGTVRDWNRGAHIIFGYAEEDVLGRSVSLLMPEVYVADHEAGMARVASGGERHVIGETVEMEGVRCDGERFPLELSLSAWTSGGERFYTAIIRDISRRKEAERALRESEARTSALLGALPDAMVVLDRDGTYLDVHVPHDYDAFTDPYALKGQKVRDVFPADPDRAMRLVERTLETGATQAFEYTVEAGGQTRHREARIVPYGDDQVVSLQRDITERKTAEEALRQREALLRTVVTNVPVMLFMMDADGVITLAEGRGLRALGVEPQEMVGDSALERYDQFPEMQRDVRRALAGEALSATLEVEGLAFEYWYAPLTDASGAVTNVVCVAADITDLKRSERHLERSRAQLRQLTARLQNIREEECTRIAREVHDVLGQQLTALRMDLAWMQRRVQDDQQTLEEQIEDAKAHVSETIQTVRRIATDLRPGVLDDLGLAAALAWQAQDYEDRTGTTYTFTDARAGEAAPLVFHPKCATALFRIFQEILTNVSRHAGASAMDVRLRTDDGDFVMAVQDDGRGFDTDAVGQKASLGLLGMRERVHGWGGTVQFDSAPGAGTTVTVAVPLERAEAAASTEATADVSADGPPNRPEPADAASA